ncbi:uncharacterized protein N7498_002821 [Penicillium cinerascens]|uniref:Uncharacterized protein n=1 Tax=Penicillium cinerascens TaxID=70096 RepID=A0A9W9NCH1_9EURO|nr:uncharacterized protein N7498_002821 [Penicillium cinerascens]KAJ5216414.1 hypothetical protein N7498_002821 [Penicillium cinerascens]
MTVIECQFTTGVVEMFDGTTDGREAYLDTSTGATNLNHKKIHHIRIHDIRTQKPAPQLLREGYETMIHPTSLTEAEFMTYRTPEGKQMIKDRYWPELQALIQQKTGAAKVVPWHFSLRNQTLGYHPDEIFFMKTGISQPASTLHIDNDHSTALGHLQRELGEEEAKSLICSYKRWAIINVWRPVGAPVRRWPLLVVDHSNVPNWNYADNVARVYRNNDPKYYKAHDNFLKPHPDYIFRYVSELRPDEVIMFKDYDSRTDRVRGTPHGGFQDDKTADDAPARRSIEVRLFVFFDDE